MTTEQQANPFNYQHVPSDAEMSLQKRLDAAVNELRQRYAYILNDWLEGRVREFCPGAYRAFQEGKPVTASTILNSAGYGYAISDEGIVDFVCGETVLARCKIETKLNNSVKFKPFIK